MLDWIRENETAAWCVAALSVLTFFGTLIVVPWLIVRIPADYFVSRRRPDWMPGHPALRVAALAGKNLLGVVLILAGLVMTVAPGQGLLTILLGVLLLDFPGKRRLERWLVGRPRVLRTLNWVRRRRGRAPLAGPNGGNEDGEACGAAAAHQEPAKGDQEQ